MVRRSSVRRSTVISILRETLMNDYEQNKPLDLSKGDLFDVETALEFDDPMGMNQYYVDLEKETVVMYTDDTGVSEENDRLGSLIDENPGRFVRIHSTSSDRDWEVMSAFIDDEVEDPVVRDRLRDAIKGSGAFRRFKNAVREEGLKDRWYAYRSRANRRAAINWLESHSLISREKAEEFRDLVHTSEQNAEAEDKTKEEQMTEGGVVVCRREGGHKGLSEGTEYEILDERPGDKLIQIRDDRNNKKWYNKQMFEVVEPGRERDLDDLLMNIEVEKKGEHIAEARVLFDQGGYWTVYVATPDWVKKNIDTTEKGAHLGIRKMVIVPSLDELEVNRSLTALSQEKNLAPFALKNE